MSTTQIPPTNPASSTTRSSEGGDLYDARYWESAYREIVEAPALLLQLQDELAQARRREAFWISAWRVIQSYDLKAVNHSTTARRLFGPRRARPTRGPGQATLYSKRRCFRSLTFNRLFDNTCSSSIIALSIDQTLLCMISIS